MTHIPRISNVRSILFFAPQPLLILLYWVFGWHWPIYLVAAAVWISFAAVVLATGITKIVNEPLAAVTIHISKVRAVPSRDAFLVSVVIMLLTFHVLIHAAFHTTLLAYCVVCIVNLVTRALSWYAKLTENN